MGDEVVGGPGGVGGGGAAGGSPAPGIRGTDYFLKEDVEGIVRGRVGADEDYTQLGRKLIAMAPGMDVKAALKQMDEADQKRDLTNRSSQTGIPLNLLEEFSARDVRISESTRSTREIDHRTTALELRDDPLYASLKDPQVLSEVIREANRGGSSLREAFMLSQGEKTLRQLQADMPRLIEAKVQERMNLGGIEGAGGELPAATVTLTATQKSAAGFLGMSEGDYMRYSKITNIEQHQAFIESQKDKK